MERLHRAASRAISGCFSFSPIPLFLYEAFLSNLQVTLTHFTLSFYEQALRLPTSFPISGLARLGVKPRLYRSSWRALTSTHPLMLPSTSPREVLLAFPPLCPWNQPSFTVESTLSSRCSRYDLPLPREKCGSRSPWDTLSSRSGFTEQIALFPFPFGKGGSGVLCQTAPLLWPLRPTFFLLSRPNIF